MRGRMTLNERLQLLRGEELEPENEFLKACRLNDLKTVKSLYESNPSILQYENFQGQDGYRVAIEAGNLEIVKFLWKEVYYIRGYGFHTACEEGQLEIVKFLFEEIQNISDGIDRYFATNHGFLNACAYSHIEVVKFL